MKNILKLPILCITLILASACSEEEDCSMTARPMMQCNLFRVEPNTGNVVRDTLKQLTVTALGTDSVIINRQQNVRDISLPLRYALGETSLVFHYFDEANEELPVGDTITISHTNTPYFISMDCGYQMKQAITKVAHTRHAVDSVIIVNPEAGLYANENIKIYHRH